MSSAEACLEGRRNSEALLSTLPATFENLSDSASYSAALSISMSASLDISSSLAIGLSSIRSALVILMAESAASFSSEGHKDESLSLCQSDPHSTMNPAYLSSASNPRETLSAIFSIIMEALALSIPAVSEYAEDADFMDPDMSDAMSERVLAE